MNLKVKRRLTYTTIVLYNLCTGIGYAIIFPTIWNYVHIRFGGSSAMLGVIISAYSISAFFANPIVGWWGDKTQNTKVILIITVATEIFGSVMYFIGISTWFLVLSRFVAGIGGGGGAAVFADITRTTSEEERTPVLSMVVASRQLGLLVGPAFNLFLSKLDFYIGSYPVDKYTSPGLFMALLWVLIEMAVLFLYVNLTSLKDEEDMEQFFQGYGRCDSVPTSEIPNTQTGEFDASSSMDVTFNSSYPKYPNNSALPANLRTSLSTSVPNLQVDAFKDFEDNSKMRKKEIKTINCKKIYLMSDDPMLYSHWPPKHFRTGSDHSGSATDTMIESAERFMQSNSDVFRYQTDIASTSQAQAEGDIPSRRTSEGINIPSTPYDSSFPSSTDETTGLLENVKNGYFRDEIVVLLGLSFISAFAQTVLETVVTPLAQKLYSFGEMENSLIYLFAGIEIILVFVAIKFSSRKLSDRTLLLFGLLTLCTATAVPLLFAPSAIPGQMKTLPYFILTVIIDLIGIGIIVVCSASLLSKVINQENQAFSQGLRRSMSCLGCIMGPLWGGAYLYNLYFLFAVPLAVSLLIAVLFLCSYRKLG